MGLGFVIFMEFIPVPHQNGGLMCIHMIYKYIYIYTIYIFIYIYTYISVSTSRMSFMVFTNPKNNLGFSGEKHWTIGMVGATSRNRSRLVGNPRYLLMVR